MPTYFKNAVTFTVNRTATGQYLDTTQDGVTVVAPASPRPPWPIQSARIIGTTKTVHAPRWDLINITVVNASETTATLRFKIDVPVLGEQYRNFNTSQHKRDVDLRSLFDNGGGLEMTVALDALPYPLTVILPAPT